ncbi:hypothetical protein BOX15_Mlig009988g1 [Macrostomum lignano]|uniref:Uncharacterized protein n=1 Tax=Macrostomum lignano TaxID=282301 RepID=A0A267DBG0_9PLAT|nr:hypothetical protein BOX15_Mlig009988g2 [Macrostomum lignano]PAA57685.1 hypothetical protein BOX15_Mlig009988g1 [Macrostomum lignano]
MLYQSELEAKARSNMSSEDEASNASYETAPDGIGGGQQRRPWSRMSDEKHSLVIDALDRGERPVDVARWFQVNIKTVLSIRRRYEGDPKAAEYQNLQLPMCSTSLTKSTLTRF